MDLLLLAHVAATLFMVGVIWFVQVVHYPLFGRVDAGGFPVYSEARSRLTTMVVAPPMLVAATAAALVLQPPGFPSYLAPLGLALLAVVWLSTALLHPRVAR